MSDVIRHGTIVVDLVQGKVALTPPDMGPVLSARQKEIELINQIEAGQKRLIDLQNEMLRPRDGGGATPGAGDGGVIPGMPSPEEVDESARAQNRLSIAYRETGEGALRVARATVLLSGAQGETFEQMIRGLAIVQGLHDLYAGSVKIVENVARAEALLTAAKAAQTGVVATNTGATAANAVATTAMARASTIAAGATAALALVLNPITLTILALAAAVKIATDAFDFFHTSEEEAREAADRTEQAYRRQIATFNDLGDALQRANELERAFQTDRQRDLSLAKEAEGYARNARGFAVSGEALAGTDPKAAIALLQAAQREAASEGAALRERDQLNKSILDTQTRQKENAIEAIKRQDQLVQSAQRQLDVEKQRSDQQIGRLSKLQQEQLRSLRDRQLRGDDLSRGEEERLEELRGGVQDGAIVDAAKKLKEAADALKSLTQGATAAAKIAEYEADKQKLETAFAGFRKSLSVQIEETVKLMRSNAERIHELEITTAINAAQQ